MCLDTIQELLKLVSAQGLRDIFFIDINDMKL